MKKSILISLLAVLLVSVSTQGAMTYTAAAILKNAQNVNQNNQYMNPLYLWANEAQARLQGTEALEGLRILEGGSNPVKYTKLIGGDQAADLTLTLPTAYAATTGYVLSSTDAGVLSWVANAGTWAGGDITSNATLLNGIYLRSHDTDAQSAAIQVYDTTAAPSFTNVLSWLNGAVPDIVLGASTNTVAIVSTGLNVTAAGAVTGVAALTTSGTASINDSATTSTTSIGGGTTTGTVTVGGTGTQAINLGNGAGIKTVALGSNTTTSGTTILSGTTAGVLALNASAGGALTNIGTGTTTGTVTIGGTGTQQIDVGSGAGNKTVNVGSNTASATTTILSGTGSGLTVNANAGNTTTGIGTGTTTGAVTLGGGSNNVVVNSDVWDISAAGVASGLTGITSAGGAVSLNASSNFAVSLASGTSTGTVLIGDGAGAQTITIGNGAAVKTVALGSSNTTSTTTILGGDNGVLINVDALNNPTNINTGGSTGTVTIGDTGIQTISIAAGGTGAKTINIGDGASTGTTTIKGGSGGVAINASNGTVVTNIGTGTTTGTVTLGGTGIMAIDVGAGGTGAKTIRIGDGASTGSVTLYSGSGDLTLKSTDDILIGQDSVAQHITIGNETGDSALLLKAGTGNIDIQGVAATTITIGDAAQTAAITIGASTATMTDLSLGTGVGAHTIHIGDGGTAAQVVTIGSTSSTSGVTVQAGTGDLALTSVDDITLNGGSGGSLINIGTNTHGNVFHIGDDDTTADTGTIGSAKDTWTLNGIAVTAGSTGTTSTLTLQSGSGGVNVNASNNQPTNIGTGTSTGTVTIGGAAAQTIAIGNGAAAKTVTLGSTDTTSTTTINSGSGGISLAAGSGAITSQSTLNAGTATGCTATEYSNNGFHRTVLTFGTGTSIALDDKDDGNGAKIYDFPEGNVIVLGCFMDLVVTTDVHVTGNYSMAAGTAAAADGDNDLTSTEADFIAKATVTQGAGDENAHSVSALTAGGQIMVPIDGTSSPKDMYLNASIAAANIDLASAVVTKSGTIVIEWIYLGDY